jgi:N-acetylmuramoyl-L-alanine amidase
MKSILFYILATVLLYKLNPPDKLSAKNSEMQTSTPKESLKIVVIDPGHGGIDYGASIGEIREKDIVLEIALQTGKLLQEAYPELQVLYTRKTDVFVPLHHRAEMANKNNADLFISIHANTVGVESVNGTETYVLGLPPNENNLEIAKMENAVILLEDDYNKRYEGFNPKEPESNSVFEQKQDEFRQQSIDFALEVQKQLKDHAHRTDRSVKQAGFLVLRKTTMPGILIETGFLSHKKDREYLLSQAGKFQIAESIIRAFSIYKLDVQAKSNFNIDKVASNNETTRTSNPGTVNKGPTAAKLLSSISDSTKQEVHTTHAKQQNNSLYYSVQIMALKRKAEPTPANFKGEKDIFRLDGISIHRYFSGKFKSASEAFEKKISLKKKFPDCFVVIIENEKIISQKKVSKQ